jgi:hypothetical protein
MKKISLALITLIIVGICIPAVSAETIIDEEFVEYQFCGGTRSSTAGASSYNMYAVNTIRFADITKHDQVTYIIVELKHDNKLGDLEEGRTVRTYTLGGRQDTAVVYVEHMRNLLGQITSTVFRIFPQNWNNEGLSGQQNMIISPSLASIGANSRSNDWVNDLAWPCNDQSNIVGAPNLGYNGYSIVVSSIKDWKNHLTVESTDNGNSYQIELKREYDTQSYYSKIDLKYDDAIVLSDYDHLDFSHITIKSQINGISISSLTSTYNRTLTNGDIPGGPPPEDHTVTVYIKNSQTGALIANANIVIDALVDGEYYPVVNRTEPSGIFTITLQPTGGGKPNPDGYRLIVTADGYNNPMPEINFTVDDYKNYIHCLLDPIAGGPVNENKTFIDFFVRDMSSNPISGATVKFGKYTLITNSAGYTVFEVDKNNNYTWTISKSGYGPLTGNAVIGDAPRHTINTVLAPIVTPIVTTPIPTSPPIGPTPTMTSPTGEPVSNWLEWFAAHFGMILGGGVEIGKIFMWLCFTVPVGVYVGKEAKAGAAGFMAGAGIVTLFFVLIGWVPIWLVVLLALIIGLLYAKMFNSPDNGGGR